MGEFPSSFGGVFNLHGNIFPSSGVFLYFPQGFAHIIPLYLHFTIGGGTRAGRSAPHFLHFVRPVSKLAALHFVHSLGFSFGGLQLPQ
jgi:hypothetical protein